MQFTTFEIILTVFLFIMSCIAMFFAHLSDKYRIRIKNYEYRLFGK